MNLVIRDEENIEICNLEKNILSTCWTIDCKYYRADTNLCTSNNLDELSDQFVDNINAVIVLFNIQEVCILNANICVMCIIYTL